MRRYARRWGRRLLLRVLGLRDARAWVLPTQPRHCCHVVDQCGGPEPWFFTALFGTAAVCILLTVFSLFNRNAFHAISLLAGSILVTMAFNVPLNDALGAVNPYSVEGAALWTRSLANWTAANHVRTAASSVAAALFSAAVCL